jgi:periodic tryptophan protein 1
MDIDSEVLPKSKADDLAEYNLDDYDDDVKDDGALLPLSSTLSSSLNTLLAVGPFSNIKGLTYYKDNEEDPYITLQDVCCMIYAHSTPSLTEFFLRKTTTNVKS